MENLLMKIKNKKECQMMMAFITMMAVRMQAGIAYADSNTAQIDGFIDFACDWLTKIGGVIALVGGVIFALGWQRQDSEGKSNGLMTMMAGFMLVAIAASKGIFGL